MNQDHEILNFIDSPTLEKLVDRLTQFILGEIDMSDEQIEAAMLIVDRTIPSLKPVTLEEAFADQETY